MKKIHNQMAFLFLVFIFSYCSDERITQYNNNYDFNGGFEKSVYNDSQLGVGWFPTILPETSGFVQFNWDSEVKHSGEFSVSISIKENYPVKDTVAYNWTKPFMPVKVNQPYVLKGWIKTSNLKEPAFIVVQCWDSKYNMIGFSTSCKDYPLIGTNDWKEVKVNFVPPQNTAEVRIRLCSSAPFNTGGKVWYDDISIE
jgi:hypothetical protein